MSSNYLKTLLFVTNHYDLYPVIITMVDNVITKNFAKLEVLQVELY